MKRIIIVTALFISIAIGTGVVINNNVIIEKVNALTCTCCGIGSSGSNCINANSHPGDTCSWPWDMCGNKYRCSYMTTVRSCSGGAPACNPNSWSGWSACSASCPAGYGGIRYGSRSRRNDCGSTQSTGCSTCCAQNVQPTTLSSPQDGATVSSLTPTLTWNPTANWGFRCPNNQIRNYNLQLGPAAPNGSCNITNWTFQRTVDENTTSVSIPRSADLIWGVKYCWRVQTINNNTRDSATWSFTPNINSYFQTYGGDVYIGTGVPDSIKTAPDNLDILEVETQSLERVPNNSRIKAFQRAVADRAPFVSSNLFVSPSLVISDRASDINNVVNFDDSDSVDQYSNIYISDDFSDQRSYTDNFFSYYKNDFTQKAVTDPNIVSGQLNKNTLTGTTVREAFGITSTEEKRIVIFENLTTGHNFELKGSSGLNAQSGFNYDDDDTFSLINEDDWAAVAGGSRVEELVCQYQTIFLIPGNLQISADIVNANKDSSCIFIVEGHVSSTLPDILNYDSIDTQNPVCTPNENSTFLFPLRLNSRNRGYVNRTLTPGTYIASYRTGYWSFSGRRGGTWRHNFAVDYRNSQGGLSTVGGGENQSYATAGLAINAGAGEYTQPFETFDGFMRFYIPDRRNPDGYYDNSGVVDINVYRCNQNIVGSTSPYRIIEALILSNSVSFAGKDDHGPVIVNGSVITNNTVQTDLQPKHFDPFRANKFDIKTYKLERPQVFMTYDPRHITLWAEELKGEAASSTIRESRFLRLIQESETIRQPQETENTRQQGLP